MALELKLSTTIRMKMTTKKMMMKIMMKMMMKMMMKITIKMMMKMMMLLGSHLVAMELKLSTRIRSSSSR